MKFCVKNKRGKIVAHKNAMGDVFMFFDKHSDARRNCDEVNERRSKVCLQ